ncbi:MAG: hypothetical protein ACXVH3_31050 [Solirubrobacteraceae bacterium]
MRVHANGRLYGSRSYVFRPTQAPAAHYKVTVTGQLAKSARTAVITFHNTSSPVAETGHVPRSR